MLHYIHATNRYIILHDIVIRVAKYCSQLMRDRTIMPYFYAFLQCLFSYFLTGDESEPVKKKSAVDTHRHLRQHREEISLLLQEMQRYLTTMKTRRTMYKEKIDFFLKGISLSFDLLYYTL